jgi:hypothetical protein
MNWLTVFGLALGAAAMLVVVLRIERRALWVALVFLVGPVLLAIGAWAILFGHWLEVLAGFALGGIGVGAWWLLAGRHLPPASSDNIKVWGQEGGARPKRRDTAAMQAEINELRDEATRLQEEIRRLKGDNGRPEGG